MILSSVTYTHTNKSVIFIYSHLINIHVFTHYVHECNTFLCKRSKIFDKITTQYIYIYMCVRIILIVSSTDDKKHVNCCKHLHVSDSQIQLKINFSTIFGPNVLIE